MNDVREVVSAVQERLAGESHNAAEIFVHQRATLAIQSKDAQVDSLDRAETMGLALRVEHNGRLGFAYTTDFANPALDRLVKAALESANTVEPKQEQRLSHQVPEPATDLNQFDHSLAARPLTDKVDTVLAMESHARDYDERVSHVRMSTYEETSEQILLWNSHIGERQFKRTLCQLHLMVMAGDSDNQESAWNLGFAPFFEQLDPASVAEEAAEEAVRLLGASAMPTGSYPAVLDRAVVAQCLGILAPSFLADAVQKHKSRLADRLGETIYSPGVTLYDDGLYSGGIMTAPFDAEGIPSQTTCLVGNGRLEAYLYDTMSGQVDGQPSSGNCVREDFKEMPRAGTRNFYLAPGDQRPDQLRAEIAHGVHIQDVIGIHTANPITGDFSVGAAGFRIEKGSLMGPIRGFAISGNLHDILARVEALGDDLKFYGSVGAPSIRISELELGGI